MMMSRLVHPKLLERLNIDFFNRYGTIQQATKSQSTTGQEMSVWANVPGMESIKCRIAASGGGERRFRDQAYLDATDTALLSGAYAATEQMRFVDDAGNTYDILRVEQDSEGITTRLTLRTVR